MITDTVSSTTKAAIAIHEERMGTGYYGQVDDSITGDTDITRPFGHAPNRRFGDLMTVLNPSPGANPNEKNIWFHVSSLGEFEIAKPIYGSKYHILRINIIR